MSDHFTVPVHPIEQFIVLARAANEREHDPGDMPGVGGPIDVAIITPEKGFTWVSKKNLVVGNTEVNLQSIKDIE